MIERHAVPLPDGKLALALHLPAGAGAFPCVLACHGLAASKESDKYLLLGAEFPRRDLALARFDFRGCGESTGVESETTVGTRLEDAGAVLAWLEGHPRLDGRLGLLGSSLGGFVALHLARERADVPPVVTWNAPADLLGLGEPGPEERARFGSPFLAELAAGGYAAPPTGVGRHLVIHGAADDVVPLAHGRRLHAAAAEPRGLVVIPGADHRLTDPTHRRQAVRLSLAWFLRFLGASPRESA